MTQTQNTEPTLLDELVKAGAAVLADEQKFEIDFRVTNPGLHALYVEQALEALAMVDRCILDISDLAKTTVFGLLEAMHNERAKLVATDAAYFVADRMLKRVNEINESRAEPK